MYRVRHFYPRRCLLMFYDSFAKSVITYGLLVYGNTSKQNLEKIDRVQRKIIRAIFFRKKYESLGLTLIDNKIYTVYELYVIELVKELFKQIRSESPLQYIIPQSLAVIKKQTRWSLRGLFPPSISKTTKNKKSLANLLKKTCNWLKQLNLLPENFQNFSFQQVKAHISKISELYIKDNRDVFALYY